MEKPTRKGRKRSLSDANPSPSQLRHDAEEEEKVERFFEIVQKIRAIKWQWRNRKKKVDAVEASWRPSFQREDFEFLVVEKKGEEKEKEVNLLAEEEEEEEEKKSKADAIINDERVKAPKGEEGEGTSLDLNLSL